MKNLVYVVICCFSLSYVASLWADNTKVERAQTEATLETDMAKLNQTCSSQAKFKVQWESFKPADVKRYSISSFCGSAIDGVTRLCIGEQTKAYVQKNLKSITCTYGGKDQRDIQVKSGELIYSVDFEAANADEMIRTELLRKL